MFYSRKKKRKSKKTTTAIDSRQKKIKNEKENGSFQSTNISQKEIATHHAILNQPMFIVSHI